jgi:hypothetical protein
LRSAGQIVYRQSGNVAQTITDLFSNAMAVDIHYMRIGIPSP